MKKPKFKQVMRAINNYVVFFLLVAFMVSCWDDPGGAGIPRVQQRTEKGTGTDRP